MYELLNLKKQKKNQAIRTVHPYFLNIIQMNLD